uniref:Protein kinase domain-containing protein n=1 Tax=Timema monikensis TaxID=170555 RepID=A0A7R9EEY5_9NEOP|nr:unnamed protein product [Timema monikensis]
MDGCSLGMDFLNKLSSTVSSTVSQLSGVLPGNPVTREFEATTHIASAGPGLLWKVYRGYKKSTKQDASIFVFEKRQLERWPRGDRDTILDSLRRGIHQLTKLRHPQILTVQHPLEESRESLAFATEPVFASLANILGWTENVPTPLPTQLHNFKLFEVEIKYGLLQVGEGLVFLHNDVKLLHRNICPEVVLVNLQGAWKIFGFDFCQHSNCVDDVQVNARIGPQGSQPVWVFPEPCPGAPLLAQPRLDYLAPEYCLTKTHSPSSDIFSLGMLIYALYHNGRPLHDCNGDWQVFKRRSAELKSLPLTKLQGVAQGLREYVKMMLNVTPELRPDAHQFIKIDFFEDVGVKTLNYLDSLFQWDNLQKKQLHLLVYRCCGTTRLQSPAPKIHCMTSRRCARSTDNNRSRNCVPQGYTQTPSCLDAVLKGINCAGAATKMKKEMGAAVPGEGVCEPDDGAVCPAQHPVDLRQLHQGGVLVPCPAAPQGRHEDARAHSGKFSAYEGSQALITPLVCLTHRVEILLIFMQKMELLLKLTPAAEIKTDVLPMLYRALESDAQQIQELCLSVLPTFAGLIDYPAMKNALLPRIKKLCVNTSYISVRVNCLVCVGKLLEHLDKWLVLDEVLPFLPQIPSREPAVLMGILGIYKLSLTDKKLGITKEVMATKILPFLMPLSIENGLTLNQFNALISLIKEMVSRVEGEHRTKLEQLNSIQAESKSVQLGPSPLLVGAPVPQTELEQMFSGLGLDTYMGGNAATPIPVVNTTNSTASSLSLQDKQRLARQQEALASPPAQPLVSQPAPRLPRPPAPKDLTASLIDTNLTQMRLTRPPTYNWPSPSPASGFQGTGPSPWRSASPLILPPPQSHPHSSQPPLAEAAIQDTHSLGDQ